MFLTGQVFPSPWDEPPMEGPRPKVISFDIRLELGMMQVIRLEILGIILLDFHRLNRNSFMIKIKTSKVRTLTFQELTSLTMKFFELIIKSKKNFEKSCWKD